MSAKWASCAGNAPSGAFRKGCLFAGWSLVFALVVPPACGARCAGAEPPVATTTAAPVDTQLLQRIESHVLPPCVVAGPNAAQELADYYWQVNPELKDRFAQARRVFEEADRRPFRMVTLVSGSAGVGKTFIKQEIYSKKYPKAEVVKFDITEVYKRWREAGTIEDRRDLAAGPVVLSTLPAIKQPTGHEFYDYLAAQPGSFYVIDALDEMHPDDYVSLLEQVERFASAPDRKYVHVAVFGRGAAFREYWQRHVGRVDTNQLALYVLNSPILKTRGDLFVSTWNYHGFAFKLSWAPNAAQRVPMPLADYTRWVAAGYAQAGEFASVEHLPSGDFDPSVQATLIEWAEKYPYINAMLANLAGNTMIREIVEERSRQGLPYDERQVKEAYLQKWLERDTKSDNRPSQAKPQWLPLYLQLVEEVAVKYLREGHLDEEGYFVVTDSDVVSVPYQGQMLSFPVERVLNRSGLKSLDPRTPGDRKYRFEPFWFHRLFVDLYNERVELRAAPDR